MFKARRNRMNCDKKAKKVLRRITCIKLKRTKKIPNKNNVPVKVIITKMSVTQKNIKKYQKNIEKKIKPKLSFKKFNNFHSNFKQPPPPPPPPATHFRLIIFTANSFPVEI